MSIWRWVLDAATLGAIIAGITVVWNSSGWVSNIDASVSSISDNQMAIVQRVKDLEDGDKEPTQITREADIRTTRLEATYGAMEKRLVRIENKLDKLVDER